MSLNYFHVKLFAEFCATYSLYSLIKVHTRITKSHSSTIEVCVTNSSNISYAGTICNGISDHDITLSVKKCARNNIGVIKKKVLVRSYSDYDKGEMFNSLRAFTWGRFYGTRDADLA